MTPQELRIGNWVKSDHENAAWIKVDGHFIMGCQQIEIAGKPLGVVGIPLTPEILEKCGFEKADTIQGIGIGGYTFVFNDTYYHIFCGNNIYSIGVINEGETAYFIWGVKYLHTLQNAYFALTQTELTINL